jgi:predicted DNA-binding protein
MDDKLKVFSVRLPAALIERLKEQQRRVGIPPSESIRRALEAWLAKQEKRTR